MGEELKYEYLARVKRVVDGDTLDLEIDLGFKTFLHVRVRLHGVNTPETFGVKKESQEYKDGVAAREFVEEWLGECAPSAGVDQKSVLILSYDGKKLRQGKYGRWLAMVYRWDAETEEVSLTSLNEDLRSEGHAEYVSY